VDGGSSRLTSAGISLLKEFGTMTRYPGDALKDSEASGGIRYRLSARNLIGATVTEIERGDTFMIGMRAESSVSLTSIISNDAVDDLGLRRGDQDDAVKVHRCHGCQEQHPTRIGLARMT
jgi:molybdopterin-binding protein